eukprot:TRINITY_DN35619_c0_g1_i1.p1 TRINITY_DN35619_c0_g1~~TRINITY_DN35619_c0_g1_i1.p1  ORF type:complete len:280 (-),score=59.88 TRINITY_DN35619_c0_g1_i1:387-1226(-)
MAARWWSKDAVAVVTGANKGIGFEIVCQLAKKDITVILTARDDSLGLAATHKLQEEGLTIDFHNLDVCSPDSIARCSQYIQETYGGFDILVNNAAIADNGTSSDLRKGVIDTNYWGVKNVTRSLLPLLRASTFGARIINVSSHLGQLKRIRNESVVQKLSDIDKLSEEDIDTLVEQFLDDINSGNLQSAGWPARMPAYCVSKVALNAYTRVLAKQLSLQPDKQKIYVNAMAPGFVKTDINNNTGIVTPAEGADTVVWLALLPPGGPTGQFFYQRKYLSF